MFVEKQVINLEEERRIKGRENWDLWGDECHAIERKEKQKKKETQLETLKYNRIGLAIKRREFNVNADDWDVNERALKVSTNW